MARKSRRSLGGIEPVPGSEKNPTGRRFVRLIEDQLRLLREQKSHGNRELFLDHLVIAHLLAFFNPMVTGLRSIDDIFNEPSVRKRYGLRRMPKSTVADAQQVFEPELLLPIIESLRERAGIQPHDKRLDQVTRELLAVDGSFFTVAPRIAWALFNNSGKGTVRLHVQFNIMDGVPDHVTLTDGQTTETSQLFDSLQAGRFYIMDRGFQNYGLFKDILQAGSDFCVRLRKSAHAEDIEDRPLTAEDLAHGVRRDTTVRLGWREGQTARLPPLRIVEIPFADRKGDEQIMRLLTNRLDLPAHLIGVIYQHRWQVELFFRWLKCIAHFRHFFSESPRGMTLQVYVAMIGLLLIAVETGARPSKYDVALLSCAFGGMITMEEALRAAARRRAERARANAWQKAYNARKKTES